MNYVSIINIDSIRIPNLALAKINKYYKDKYYDIYYDTIIKNGINYISCVFEINKHLCKEFENNKRCIIGGSGYDLSVKLPEEIEQVKPRINLGFTTRGCIRECEFCVVPQKEGRIKIVGDLLDLWDGKSKDIVLLDNNILAIPSHFRLVCKQARENKIKLDFNQGLDCRLLTEDMVKQLKSIRTYDLHFAWDNINDEKYVDKAITLLQKYEIKRCNWLVLTGFNTTFEQDLYRVNYLRNRNQVAYIMRYNNSKRKDLIPLSRWVNNRSWFRAITWEEFIERNYKGREEEYGINEQFIWRS
jgi:hypothetical protein